MHAVYEFLPFGWLLPQLSLFEVVADLQTTLDM